MAAGWPVQVRLKANVKSVDLGKRTLTHHGQFGNLHVVPARTALRLVEEGLAKLRPGMNLMRLQREVKASMAAEELLQLA
jgi:hypothetical protein